MYIINAKLIQLQYISCYINIVIYCIVCPQNSDMLLKQTNVWGQLWALKRNEIQWSMHAPWISIKYKQFEDKREPKSEIESFLKNTILIDFFWVYFWKIDRRRASCDLVFVKFQIKQTEWI